MGALIRPDTFRIKKMLGTLRFLLPDQGVYLDVNEEVRYLFFSDATRKSSGVKENILLCGRGRGQDRCCAFAAGRGFSPIF